VKSETILENKKKCAGRVENVLETLNSKLQLELLSEKVKKQLELDGKSVKILENFIILKICKEFNSYLDID